MNPIDIEDLALNVSRIIGGLDDHTTRGPLLVTRNGEPEAVIIRHQAYAPRLGEFDMTHEGDLLCRRCPGRHVIQLSNPYNVGAAAEAANAHWREQHKEQK